jgi:hypothetical protein
MLLSDRIELLVESLKTDGTTALTVMLNGVDKIVPLILAVTVTVPALTPLKVH